MMRECFVKVIMRVDVSFLCTYKQDHSENHISILVGKLFERACPPGYWLHLQPVSWWDGHIQRVFLSKNTYLAMCLLVPHDYVEKGVAAL